MHLSKISKFIEGDGEMDFELIRFVTFIVLLAILAGILVYGTYKNLMILKGGGKN